MNVTVGGGAGELSFTSSNFSVNENGGTASVTVRRIGGSSGAVSARCNTGGGSATAGSDYTSTTDTLSWANGDTANKTCTIPITNDTLDENNETVSLSLSNFTGGASAGSPTNATLTINDDDDAGDLSFTSSSFSVNENVGTASVTVRRTGGSSGAVSVRCNTGGGTATAGSDYTNTADTLSWANGNTANKTCTIPINNDSEVESSETINLSLSNFTGGASAGSPTNAILTINDNDVANPGDLSFTSSTYTVNENVGTASIAVRRAGGSSGAVSVRCNTGGGSATVGDDYTNTTDTLSWANGDTANKTCTIPIANDVNDENNETVNLSLSNFTGGAGSGSPNTATLTITDNDEAGDLRFSASTYQVDENVGTAMIVNVQRVGGSSGEVKVQCNTGGGTASPGSDYANTALMLTWPHGNTSPMACTIPIIDDSSQEAAETINLSLSNFTNGATVGNIPTATLTINDNDSPGALSFSTSGYQVNENANASITVRRTGGSAGAASVQCNTTDGSAIAGSDYTATSQTLNWSSGDSADKTCTVSIINDTVEENDTETVNLSLSNFIGASPGNPTDAVLTINDDDEAGSLSFSSSSYQVNEDVGSASITVTRTGGSSGAVSVQCKTANGSATAPDDYTAITETLTWANGNTANQTCTIPITNDTTEEGNETISLSLTNFTGMASPGINPSAILTILINDQRGDLSFTASSYTVTENGTASISVRRTDGSDGAVSVRCNTANGTASAPSDYTATTDILTWASGDMADKTCTVPIVADNNDENNETISLSLSNFTGGAGQGSPGAATLTIIDDDEAGNLSFTASTYEVKEEVTTNMATVQVRRTGGSDGTVTVRCNTGAGSATAGQDYTATTDTLTWSHGVTTVQTCTIPIKDDLLAEGDETIFLSLSNFTNGAGQSSPGTAVLTILDDDIFADNFESGNTCAWTQTSPPGPFLNFTMENNAVNEDVGTASITVRRSDISCVGAVNALSVRCDTSNGTAIAGTDYTATTEILNWPVGDTTDKQCIIPINNDALDENSETINLMLTNVTGGATVGPTRTAVLTIGDNDPTPTVQFSTVSQSNLEDVTSVTVTAQLSALSGLAVQVPVTFSGTAGNSVDYTRSTTIIMIPPEAISADLILNVVDDALDELNEAVVVTMGAPVNATAGTTKVHTATILDNDARPVVNFTAAGQSNDESVATVTVTAQLSAVSGLDVQVPLTFSGSATDSADYTASTTNIIIPAGMTSTDLTLNVNDDALDEDDETVIVTMGAPNNAILGTTKVHTATILDNDALPKVDFTLDSQSRLENISTVTVTAQLSTVSGRNVEVPVTFSGSATDPADYTASTTNIIITAGTTSADLVLTVVDDALDEDDETVIVTMGVPPNAMLGTTTEHIATILDNDALPKVDFTLGSQSRLENISTVTVTAQLSTVSGRNVEVPVTFSGSAADPADYTASTTNIIITAGTTSADLVLTVVDDALDEDDETVIVTMGAPPNAMLGTTTEHTATILDNDAPPTVNFTLGSQNSLENVSTVTVTAQLSVISGRDVDVPVTFSGTAANPDDYSPDSSTITIPTGMPNATLTLTVVDDAIAEFDETVEVTMGALTTATRGATDVHTATIKDNEAAALRFTMASDSVNEAVGSATMVVERVGNTMGAASVRCDTSNGTATAGSDYTAQMNTLNWADGESGTQDCTIPVTDDTDGETDETINLTLTMEAGAALGTPSSATLTIKDNETAELNFTMAAYMVDESVGSAVIPVQRIGDTTGAASVRCDTSNGTATAGDDYTGQMETLNWTDGESGNKNCTIPVTDDTDDENDETVNLALTMETGAALGMQDTAVLTIEDNERGALSFTMSAYTESEGGTTASIDVQRTGGNDGAVSVRCDTSNNTATAGSDYTAQMDMLNWADGDITNKQCTIPITDDNLDEEDNETVNLTLTMANGASLGMQNTAVLTITDNDAMPTVDFTAANQNNAETASPVTITAQLSAASGRVVEVPLNFGGTANNSADYSPSTTTITIAAGMTSANLTLIVVDDGLVEADETVVVTMGILVNATLGTTTMHTATIQDIPGTLSFIMSSYQVDERDGTASIDVQRIGGIGGAASVRCDTADNTATEPADYTATTDTLNWTNGESTTMTCTVPIFNDGDNEGGETVDLSLTNVTGATLGTPNTATLTIIDDEYAGDLSFTMSTYQVDEDTGTGSASIEVQRTSGSGGAVSVRCDTADGDATAGNDYTATMQILNWADDDNTNQTCTVPILDETDDEVAETVALSLTTVTGGATVVSPSAATLTILDDDGPGDLSFTMSTYEVDESNGTASIEVERTGGFDGAVSVSCDTTDGTANAGIDYTATMETLNWGDGDRTIKICTVPIIDDIEDDDAETIILSLTNETGGVTVGSDATLTILDDDSP